METPKALIRAGCYLRISSDPKDKREGIDRQREDTTALCEVKGWAPVDFYIDNDRSASNGRQRPAWDRMHELEDLRRFVTSLGRPVPLATTVQGDIDLYSPTGVMMAQIKTAVSEHEIAMMKVRQRRAAVQRAERGIPKWRKAFGSPRDPSQGGGRRHSPTRPGDSTFGGRCLPGRARR
jgi:DNA invertase Pin-like site-specific DNA recombinase